MHIPVAMVTIVTIHDNWIEILFSFFSLIDGVRVVTSTELSATECQRSKDACINEAEL